MCFDTEKPSTTKGGRTRSASVLLEFAGYTGRARSVHQCLRVLFSSWLSVVGGCRVRRSTAQAPSGPLVVFNAGSLAQPFRELLRAFRAKHPDVVPAQENSGSLEAARKLTELGKIPDVLGVADYGVIPTLLVPAHATWYATFARNAMVLAYADGPPARRRSTARTGGRCCCGPGCAPAAPTRRSIPTAIGRSWCFSWPSGTTAAGPGRPARRARCRRGTCVPRRPI